MLSMKKYFFALTALSCVASQSFAIEDASPDDQTVQRVSVSGNLTSASNYTAGRRWISSEKPLVFELTDIPAGYTIARLKYRARGVSTSEAGTILTEVPLIAGQSTVQLIARPSNDGTVDVELLKLAGDTKPLLLSTLAITVSKGGSIFASLGAGFLISSGEEKRTYKLVPAFKNGAAVPDKKAVVSSGSRLDFESSVSGLVYIAFDDDFGYALKHVKGRGITQQIGKVIFEVLTLGLYNEHYHRYGLVAGIGTNKDSNVSYNIGTAWFLDRDMKSAIVLGLRFQRSESWNRSGVQDADGFVPADYQLDLSQRWAQQFFIGLTYNFTGTK